MTGKAAEPRALKIGATPSRDGTAFRVWAPRSDSVSVRIMGESKEIPMDRKERGYFSAFADGLGPGARYFYVLDGDRQRPDPASRFQPEGVHGPSEVVDPESFQWEDGDWAGVPLDEMILYELHVGTFTQEGTFEGIVPFLSYLREELGVTAIELMPVSQFPGERNWGYDGACPYAPQNSYGGPAGLKSLVNACHRVGLTALFDVVYNHLGPEGNYLGDFGPYFTDRYRTPWGAAVNFDGPESDEVRSFFVDNALYWVTEYHADGLRIDAVHGIFDFSARHILEDLKESVDRQAKRLGRRITVIAESDLNDVRIINPARRGGYGLDAQWNDDFHHCLHVLLTGERNGYYKDFRDLGQMAKALREGFVYDGQYSPFRKRRHGSSSKHLPPSKFVVFSQNHDHVGNRMKGDRLSALVPFEALKLAAGIVLLSSNIPLLFMGEEYGEKAPFQYFVSHSDPELIEAVRKGRREEFSAFEWEGEVPDPQDRATFLRSKIGMELRFQGKHGNLFECYRALIRLRKEIPALSHLVRERRAIKVFEKEGVLFMRRRLGEDQVFCLFNFQGRQTEITTRLHRADWARVFDSSSEEWGGRGSLVPGFLESDGSEIAFHLDAYGFVVYRRLASS